MMKIPSLALVGRPNVGKSTLLNRLSGRRIAIVHDTPGVTRDWKQTNIKIGGQHFDLIDTAGLEQAKDQDQLAARMTSMTHYAMTKADLLVFMIDARTGLTPFDEHFANMVRKTSKDLLLVANKCEGRVGQAGLIECHSLGFGSPIGISAEHGDGIGDLLDAISNWGKTWNLKTNGSSNVSEMGKGGTETSDSGPVRLVVVGRPNAGKSTLINALVGETRLLTGPEAGLTRDAISLPFMHKMQHLELVDTAGLRRKAKIKAELEKLSVGGSLSAIRYAHVVVLMLDSLIGLDKQDLDIGRHVLEEGRNLIVALNKWDQISNGQVTLKQIHHRLSISLSQAKGIPVHTVSALQNKNIHRILDSALDLHGAWNWRLNTSDLNTWLRIAIDRYPPPMGRTGRIKLRYGTQVKSRPPTFAFFGNRVDDLPLSYKRYLENSLREAFDFWGPPLRLYFRQGKNPYSE